MKQLIAAKKFIIKVVQKYLNFHNQLINLGSVSQKSSRKASKLCNVQSSISPSKSHFSTNFFHSIIVKCNFKLVYFKIVIIKYLFTHKITTLASLSLEPELRAAPIGSEERIVHISHSAPPGIILCKIIEKMEDFLHNIIRGD